MTTCRNQIAVTTTLANGEILVTGYLSNGSNVLEKITVAGSPDGSFGANGIAVISSSGTPAALCVLASQLARLTCWRTARMIVHGLRQAGSMES